jgi:predicted NBD/HSP70 family sugar kinase
VLAERHRALDVDRSADEALDQAAGLIDTLLEEAGVDRGDVAGVGMGLPGPIDRRTGIVGSSVILPGWVGLRPADELERRLDLPVEVDNDANLGALAEVGFGAARGPRTSST